MTTSSSGNLPPAVPAYIFRGYTSPIHALQFFQSNAYLASGDSEGWIVIWSLATKRATAVWKAHEGSILAVKDWDGDRLITHGRDHKLRVWQLRANDFGSLDTRLPIDGEEAASRKEPWLLHSMSVNALNFCGFAMCYDCHHTARELESSTETLATSSTNGKSEGAESTPELKAATGDGEVVGTSAEVSPFTQNDSKPIIIAVPNALDSGAIDFFHLPSERRVSTLPADKQVKTGMVMTLSLFRHPATEKLTVISGYEAGHTMVHIRQNPTSSTGPWWWKKVLVSQPHTQPLLSLDVSVSKDFFFTSSADAVLAKCAVPSNSTSTTGIEQKPTKILNTKHAGQQGLCVRSDGKIFATAGWDARIRIYSGKTMNELAVLKWHKEGCYTVAFAIIDPDQDFEGDTKRLLTTTAISVIDRSALEAIKHQRQAKAQTTHWLAAGGKDGKISLWEIY